MRYKTVNALLVAQCCNGYFGMVTKVDFKKSLGQLLVAIIYDGGNNV